MKDEIKVILNYLDMYKNINEGLLNSKDKKLLLDYITNLQSKIDKAIEYNKEVLTWTTNEPITDEIAYKNLEILEDKGNDKE